MINRSKCTETRDYGVRNLEEVLHMLTVGKKIALGLALTLASGSAIEASAQNLCGPVYDGALINISYECWNDAVALKVDSSKKDANGWQYTADLLGDNAGDEFEIHGIAAKETADQFCIGLNSSMPSDTGFVEATAPNGSVTWGDFFLNFGTKNFAAAHSAGELFGVRFDAKNDSGVPLGVYKHVVAKNVVIANLGPGSGDRQGYENHVYAKHGIPGYGDLPTNMTYYDYNIGLNEIQSGDFLGPIAVLSPADLAALGFNLNKYSGAFNIGFCMQKNLIIDECGVLGGDGSSCRDCGGVTCGQSQPDQCGVCGGDGSSCEICYGDDEGRRIVDQCGVCGGDGTSCLDCALTPFGTKVTDRCGVCGGDGKSCLECENVNISSHQFGMDGSALRQSKILNTVLRQIKRASTSTAARRRAQAQIDQSNKLYLENWHLTWTIPSVQSQCANQQFCVNVSNVSSVESYKQKADQLYSAALKNLAKLRKLRGNSAAGKKLEKLAAAEHSKALQEAGAVPSQYSSCN